MQMRLWLDSECRSLAGGIGPYLVNVRETVARPEVHARVETRKAYGVAGDLEGYDSCDARVDSRRRQGNILQLGWA